MRVSPQKTASRSFPFSRTFLIFIILRQHFSFGPPEWDTANWKHFSWNYAMHSQKMQSLKKYNEKMSQITEFLVQSFEWFWCINRCKSQAQTWLYVSSIGVKTDNHVCFELYPCQFCMLERTYNRSTSNIKNIRTSMNSTNKKRCDYM